MNESQNSLPQRADAWALLTEYTQSDSLRRHMLAVEAAMRSYANKFGEDADRWGLAGLLHDFDYERWPNPSLGPDGHPFTGVKILRERGYPDDILEAILGHAGYSGVARNSRMAKTLFAVDELCGFVVAAAYVRPEKLTNLSSSSVKKKLKDKSFAAAVSRQDISQGIAELGVEQDEHFTLVISALQGIAAELGF